jgi:hypothetical protein
MLANSEGYMLANFRGLIVGFLVLAAGQATAAEGGTTLTHVPGSTVKLYQVNGDCDWVEWDATITKKPPTCKPTTSRTATRADVLGNDVPAVFEHDGEMIMTFGDTFGADSDRYPKWVGFKKPFQWKSHDPIAHSNTLKASDGLLVDFFMHGDHALEVLPPPQPDGSRVPMGADDVPSTGVSINGQIYLGITTGTVRVAPGQHDRGKDYSVLVKFDEKDKSFATGRRISALPQGHFVRPIFHLSEGEIPNSPGLPSDAGPVVWTFGVSPAARGIYLSMTPAGSFWTGTDANGHGATRYFAGFSGGRPSWSADEAEAKPLIGGPDASNAAIPYATVAYSKALGLWIMMFDSAGKGPESGMYVTYASSPWGPWSRPQLVFNPCRDHGFGNFMFYFYETKDQNDCPSAMPAGSSVDKGSAGPAGPTAGNQQKNVADKTRGIAYGPALVERFMTVEQSKLKLFYMLSTWNPYAIVMMESDFQIGCGSPISAESNSRGEAASARRGNRLRAGAASAGFGCPSGPGDGPKPPGSLNPNPSGGKTNPL